jgi:hypothetical protein
MILPVARRRPERFWMGLREPFYICGEFCAAFVGTAGAAAKTIKLVRTLPYTDENDCLDKALRRRSESLDDG